MTNCPTPQRLAYSPKAETFGGVHELFLALPTHEKALREFAEPFGLANVQPTDWCNMLQVARFYAIVGDALGQRALYQAGAMISEVAEWPFVPDSLEQALAIYEPGYKLNHRGGEAGYIKLCQYEEAARYAVMECQNPYPDELQRGMLTEMLVRFAPGQSRVDVRIDTEAMAGALPRSQGGYYTRFRLSW